MYYDQNMFDYLQQLWKNFQTQQEKMKELEKQVTELNKELITLKSEPRIAIDRIEYKFDQLKIEKLDGTLNIGLTPNSGKQLMDDMNVNGESMDLEENEATLSPIGQNIKAAVNHYLQKDVYDDIKTIEQRLQYHLTDEYRQFIVKDIQNQLNERINAMTKRYPSEQLENNSDQVEEEIYLNIKAGILEGIEGFINNLKMGANQNEFNGD